MKQYYIEKLSAKRLQRVYETAPQTVQNYLDAEIEFIQQRIKPKDHILELGCGYGRVIKRLANSNNQIIGIDNAPDNIEMAHQYLKNSYFCQCIIMNAIEMSFPPNLFDITICIQNGISAFNVDKKNLIKEAIRVTKKGGRVIFSSYSKKFWDIRLQWFRLQAELGLIDEIDEDKTGKGMIACKDGFQSTTVDEKEFNGLTADLGVSVEINEVAKSSIFCEIFI